MIKMLVHVDRDELGRFFIFILCQHVVMNLLNKWFRGQLLYLKHKKGMECSFVISELVYSVLLFCKKMLHILFNGCELNKISTAANNYFLFAMVKGTCHHPPTHRHTLILALNVVPAPLILSEWGGKASRISGVMISPKPKHGLQGRLDQTCTCARCLFVWWQPNQT